MSLNLEAEMSLLTKLHSLKVICKAFDGDTDVAKRKVIVRRDILDSQVEWVVFTVERGKHVTIAQQFQRAYSEPL